MAKAKTHEDGEPLTTEQRQSHHGQTEKNPADGDGPLTVGEVAPQGAEQQAVPMRPSATTNPSQESQVDNPADQAQNMSANEMREQARDDAQDRQPGMRGRK